LVDEEYTIANVGKHAGGIRSFLDVALEATAVDGECRGLGKGSSKR
jgi:hypothetical protein